MARKTTTLILFVVMVFIFGCDKISSPPPVPDVTDPGNYVLVWSDEFDQRSSTPDPAKWNYDLGYGGDGWGNDEWQIYTDDLENVRVEDGNLVISTLWDSVNHPEGPGKRNGSVSSGRINTKDNFAFKYGKAQARIKIPTAMGMWPAFWMLGQNYDSAGWPQSGEIDIMEASPLYHNDRTSMFTMHWYNDEVSAHNSYGTTVQLRAPLSQDYHVYEVEWDEQRVIGKIDGINYFIKVIDPEYMDEFLKEFFLILNVAVGGNLGGSPDASTVWPQNMFVDWVRVYQKEQSLIPVETYGIFTDQTPVDDGLTVGLNAEIYVWENTLTPGNIPPYEGTNVISWVTAGMPWFGAGIKSNAPVDLSGFAGGNLKFMIKIPANVSFKIGINDTGGIENYVTFPANQTAYGLVRNGEWAQASIPVADITGNVDLESLNYEFIILEQAGTQCAFAIDDIYYDGGGSGLSSLSFNAASYEDTATNAIIQLQDTAAVNSVRTVTVSNGTQSISVGISLNYTGVGSAAVSFGPTNDETNTIQIAAGNTLTASYTSISGSVLTDTASITGGASADTKGIYSETHTNPVLPYTQIINSADWSGNPAEPNEESTAVSPVDGNYVLSVNFGDTGHGWGGVAFNFGSQDASGYTTFVISINKSAMPTLAHFGIKFEDAAGGQKQLDIASYTPVISGNWARYEIPVSHFIGVNFSSVKFLGLWNPTTASNAYLTGNLYFDDIYLKN